MNEKNLMPISEVNSRRSREEHSEHSRRGGIASGQSRREKKTIRNILSDLLEGQVSDNPQFAEIASKLGLKGNQSVKSLFTVVCLLNSARRGDLSDLERLGGLLGEDTARDANNGILEELTEYLKEENTDAK